MPIANCGGVPPRMARAESGCVLCETKSGIRSGEISDDWDRETHG